MIHTSILILFPSNVLQNHVVLGNCVWCFGTFVTIRYLMKELNCLENMWFYKSKTTDFPKIERFLPFFRKICEQKLVSAPS
jgi:hypothetical protein